MGFILWSMFVRTAERLLQTVQETYRNSGNNQLFLNEEYFTEIITGIYSRRGVFRCVGIAKLYWDSAHPR